MRPKAAVFVSCLAACALAAVSAAPAAAAPQRISGKLSKAGYTVMALVSNNAGVASSARARHGRFSLRPIGTPVTLHLRDRNGRYAGPIVIGGHGARAVLGVRAGAKLGRIKVRRGYARVAKRPPGRWIDTAIRSRAKHGVPIGARVFGRVRSRAARASARGPDPDRDGIPNTLDIDDDGDLRLDNFESSARGTAAASISGSPIGPRSKFQLEVDKTVNANAGSLTRQDIDSALAALGHISVTRLDGDSQELDCGGLSYCSRGGTGRWAYTENQPQFPECCDPDDDGFGTMRGSPGSFADDFWLRHGATSSEIRTGDVLVERVTTNGVETQYPGVLQFVFATVPALISYHDTAGHSAAMQYPVARDGPGTAAHGLPISPGPDGQIRLTLIFWRPQRLPIGSESGNWIDIGGLTYTTGLGCVPDLPDPEACALKQCPLSAYSTREDFTRTTFNDFEAGGLVDQQVDVPADPSDTFSYDVNLTKCLNDPRGAGLKTKPIPWARGEERQLFFIGMNLNDFAEQDVYFKLE